MAVGEFDLLASSSHFCVALLRYDKVDFSVTPKVPFWSEWQRIEFVHRNLNVKLTTGVQTTTTASKKNEPRMSFHLIYLELKFVLNLNRSTAKTDNTRTIADWMALVCVLCVVVETNKIPGHCRKRYNGTHPECAHELYVGPKSQWERERQRERGQKVRQVQRRTNHFDNDVVCSFVSLDAHEHFWLSE